MSQSDTFTREAMIAGPSKKFKDTLVVGFGYPSTVVFYFDDNAPARALVGPDPDL